MDLPELVARVRWVVSAEPHPFDAYRVARRTALSAQEAGQALILLEDAGEILSLGEGGTNPLAELYVRSEK